MGDDVWRGLLGEGMLATLLSFGELTRLARLNRSSRRLHDAAWRAIWESAACPDQPLACHLSPKTGKATKAPGRADGTRGKGKGVVNAETAASALSSTQDNTVRVADVLQRLAVQGTVQPGGLPLFHLPCYNMC